MRNKSLFDGYKELKIVNIESLFFAFLLGFTLKDNGVSLLLCLAGGIALILMIKVLFRFRLGYFLVSAAFSAFWIISVSTLK